MLLVSTQALSPLEIIDLIVFDFESKVEPALVSVVMSEIFFLVTIAILAKGFIGYWTERTSKGDSIDCYYIFKKTLKNI